MKKTTFTSPLDAILKNVRGSDELHYRMFSLCEMHSGKHFCRYRRYYNFKWLPLTKYTVAAVATVAEIDIFLSQRRSSPLSAALLLSLKSVFPYIATVAETRFSTTAVIVATGAIIWKPGFTGRLQDARPSNYSFFR